jgi:hypothetical protein
MAHWQIGTSHVGHCTWVAGGTEQANLLHLQSLSAATMTAGPSTSVVHTRTGSLVAIDNRYWAHPGSS